MHKKKFTAAPYLLVAPALIVVLLVVFIPIIYSVSMSFQSYDLRFPNDIAFSGLENYRQLLGDIFFWKASYNTFFWVLLGVGFQFIFGFILALLLNSRIPGRGVLRTLSLVPWVTPGILIGLMWRWMYDGNYGVINDVITRLTGEVSKISFLANVDLAFPAVIITLVWQGIPFFALMLLAGMQGVNSELYEAAEIDGANRFKKLIYITIPSIKNSILVSVMLRIIWVANSLDIIYAMTEGGPAAKTQTLAVYIYKKALGLDLGYASAMGLVLMLMLAVVAIPYVIITFRNQEK